MRPGSCAKRSRMSGGFSSFCSYLPPPRGVGPRGVWRSPVPVPPLLGAALELEPDAEACGNAMQKKLVIPRHPLRELTPIFPVRLKFSLPASRPKV